MAFRSLTPRQNDNVPLDVNVSTSNTLLARMSSFAALR